MKITGKILAIVFTLGLSFLATGCSEIMQEMENMENEYVDVSELPIEEQVEFHMDLLTDEDEQAVAASDLAMLGTDALPSLVEYLKEDSSYNDGLLYAAKAIAGIGPDAVEPMLELLDDASLSEETRGRAAWALGYMDPPPAEVIPHIVEMIRTEEGVRLRELLVDALEEMGPAAKEALPLLKKISNDDTDLQKYNAQTAVIAIEME